MVARHPNFESVVFGEIETTERIKINKSSLISMPPRELRAHVLQLVKSGAIQSFLNDALKDDALRAHLSYWEKWLPGRVQKMIDNDADARAKVDSNEVDETVSLPLHLEKKFEEKELEFFMKHLMSIQLTFGCSVGCPKCGFDAPRGVRGQISYNQLEKMFKKYGTLMAENKPYLYSASEPKDYKDGDKTYEDVHRLVIKKAGYKPEVTTAYGVFGDEDWTDFINNSGEVDSAKFSKWAPKNVRINKEKEKEEVPIAPDYGIKEQVPGIGVDTLRGKYAMQGIGCREGLLLTPRGLYATIQANGGISEVLPQGQIICPIERVATEPPLLGESIYDILRRGIIPRSILGEYKTGNKEIKLEAIDGKKYVIALNEELKVAAVVNNQNDCTLFDDDVFLKKIMEIRSQKDTDKDVKIKKIERMVNLRYGIRESSTEWKLSSKFQHREQENIGKKLEDIWSSQFLSRTGIRPLPDLISKMFNNSNDGMFRIDFRGFDIGNYIILRPSPEWLEDEGNRAKIEQHFATTMADPWLVLKTVKVVKINKAPISSLKVAEILFEYKSIYLSSSILLAQCVEIEYEL